MYTSIIAFMLGLPKIGAYRGLSGLVISDNPPNCLKPLGLSFGDCYFVSTNHTHTFGAYRLNSSIASGELQSDFWFYYSIVKTANPRKPKLGVRGNGFLDFKTKLFDSNVKISVRLNMSLVDREGGVEKQETLVIDNVPTTRYGIELTYPFAMELRIDTTFGSSINYVRPAVNGICRAQYVEKGFNPIVCESEIDEAFNLGRYNDGLYTFNMILRTYTADGRRWYARGDIDTGYHWKGQRHNKKIPLFSGDVVRKS